MEENGTMRARYYKLTVDLEKRNISSKAKGTREEQSYFVFYQSSDFNLHGPTYLSEMFCYS